MKFSTGIASLLIASNASAASANELPTCNVLAAFNVGSGDFQASSADKEHAVAALKSSFNIVHGGKKVAAAGIDMTDFKVGQCGWDCGSGGEDDDDYFKPSAFKEAIVSASMHVGELKQCGWDCDPDGDDDYFKPSTTDLHTILAAAPEKVSDFASAWCETLVATGGEVFANVKGCKIKLDCAEPEPATTCSVVAQYDVSKKFVEPTKAEMTYAAMSLKSSYNAVHDKETIASASANKFKVGQCGWDCHSDDDDDYFKPAAKLRGQQERGNSAFVEFSVQVGQCGWDCDPDGDDDYFKPVSSAKFHSEWEKNLCHTLAANGGAFEGVKGCKIELHCDAPPAKSAQFIEQAYDLLSKVAGKNH